MTREERREYGRLRYIARREEFLVTHRRYREENREAIRASGRKYSADNRERLAKYYQQYCRANPEKQRARLRQWRARNPEKYKERNRLDAQRRRSRKNNPDCTLTQAEWAFLLDQHFHRCHYCGKKSDALTQDHKVPISNGGAYSKENIVPACQSCNSSKGAQDYHCFVKGSSNRLQMELL